MSWGQDMPCDIGDPMQFYLFRLLVRCRASPCGRRFVLPSGSFFPLYFSLLRCAPCHSECGPLRADGSLQRRVLCGLILSLSHFGLPAQTSPSVLLLSLVLLFAALHNSWRSNIACLICLCCLSPLCSHARTLLSRCTFLVVFPLA